MTVSLSPVFNGYQSFLATGLPNNGGYIYTYAAGTTTPTATYTTNSGSTANSNPIPLSADGRPPQEIWLTDGIAYKFLLTDNLGSPISGGTFDNITGIASAGFAANLGGPGGSALVGFLQAGTGAVARTAQSKMRDQVSAKDFGADATGVVDCSAAVNAMLVAFQVVRFTAGTYLLTSDMILQTNSYVIIDEDAKIICNNCRIIAYQKNNVTLNVNGQISSINLAISTTNTWNLFYLGYAERAFIEFGGISTNRSSGFTVFGTGSIYGDLAGSSTFSPATWSTTNPDLINRKGIGVWESTGNIRISGVEVYRFKGEAVYYNCQSVNTGSSNVVFENLHVHDVGFNGVNFNAAADVPGAYIRNCIVNGFNGQAAELSAGALLNNTLSGSYGCPVQLGGGYVFDTVIIGNKITGATGTGRFPSINAIGGTNPTAQTVIIQENQINLSQNEAINCGFVGRVRINGNSINGYNSSMTAGVFAIQTNNLSFIDVSGNSIAGGGIIQPIAIAAINQSVTNNYCANPAGTMDLIADGPYLSLSGDSAKYSDIYVPSGTSSISQAFRAYSDESLSTTPTNVFAKATATATGVGIGNYIISANKSSVALNPVTASMIFTSGGQVTPGSDGAQAFGTASLRWSVIYAATGSINTSDEREKTDIADIDAAAIKAWSKVQFKQFRFKNSEAEKGGAARLHFGVIAQQVKAAFEAEGIDPFLYGILCYDEWPESPAVLDADNNISTPAVPAGNRYGIRYDEALVLECAYLRSRLPVEVI